MVTLKVFDNPIDAHILKTKLESEGIHSYLFDENIVGINPLLNIAVGGIKLKVSSDDLEKALQLLAQSDLALLEDNKNKTIVCPHCNSNQIDNTYNKPKGIRSILSTLFSLFTFTYPLYINKSYRCKNCNTAFSLKEDN
ncbi:DUF2007 domain-containing protein [Sphingobacterium sp. UT-1RO-CII-1]|uniref:putative signal transducing protein n=1 Tax=Sphingobacterium sp. UT-1RO-CII-1 TaxID=2995225 RepID=UPI00227A1776|nr:DUF2007 domain-containing protein [Sphingobacterium sp. UT-1RO-CII-1]MCY4781240.1 DUF2007 domain-containing protein [Sphingobacterium sp. UT-1RO-CII-1]